MSWKNWPQWVKGSIISFIILVIYLFMIDGFNFSSKLAVFLLFPAQPISNALCESGLNGLGCAIGVGIWTGIIMAVIYSLIIGWIYGKIKSKK